MNFILLAAAGLLLYKMINQADQLSTVLNYSFAGLKFIRSQSSIYVSGLQTTMILKNPSNITATIAAVSGTATMGYSKNDNSDSAGRFTLGTYFVNQSFSIPANGSVKVPLLIQINNQDAIRAIMSVIANKKTPVIQLEGNITTTVGLVPFTYQLKA